MNPATQNFVISSLAANGQELTAEFNPEGGMNLLRFRLGGCELIDPATQPLYDERFAGLGALIGPHFHHRSSSQLPPPQDRSLFKHFANLEPWGQVEPFSHGIIRYVPWKVKDCGADYLRAEINGNMLYKNIPLKVLEGQDFAAEYFAQVTPTGLFIDFQLEGENPSVIGFHYYYRKPKGNATVRSQVLPGYRSDKQIDTFPAAWTYDQKSGDIQIPIEGAFDFGFLPKKPHEATITLITEEYQLNIHSQSMFEGHSWQLYHPENASFICIEPLSANVPRQPKGKIGALQVMLSPQLLNG